MMAKPPVSHSPLLARPCTKQLGGTLVHQAHHKTPCRHCRLKIMLLHTKNTNMI